MNILLILPKVQLAVKCPCTVPLSLLIFYLVPRLKFNSNPSGRVIQSSSVHKERRSNYKGTRFLETLVNHVLYQICFHQI